MKGKWIKRNYHIEFDYDYEERIDDAPEVQKGDVYESEYALVNLTVFQGTRLLKSMPGKVIDELIEELRYMRGKK